jgi:glycogen phosphorylase
VGNPFQAKGVVDRSDAFKSRIWFGPNALTIGFGRRFATYKRASLLLYDRDRLSRLLKDNSRPVQFIFAGKAHPRDHEGKKLIQEIIQFSKTEVANGRIVFLEDYDISIARKMVQGVDVWLNNPRRPLEACGTSGMKAAPNGVLNLSILDGWWDEAFSDENGWGIGVESDTGPEAAEHQIADHRHHYMRDRMDAESLYSLLETKIVPLFYDRDAENGVPRGWVRKMKGSISTIPPVFNTRRMVSEYSNLFYFVGADQLAGDYMNSIKTWQNGSPTLDSVSVSWEK